MSWSHPCRPAELPDRQNRHSTTPSISQKSKCLTRNRTRMARPRAARSISPGASSRTTKSRNAICKTESCRVAHWRRGPTEKEFACAECRYRPTESWRSVRCIGELARQRPGQPGRCKTAHLPVPAALRQGRLETGGHTAQALCPTRCGSTADGTDLSRGNYLRGVS